MESPRSQSAVKEAGSQEQGKRWQALHDEQQSAAHVPESKSWYADRDIALEADACTDYKQTHRFAGLVARQDKPLAV